MRQEDTGVAAEEAAALAPQEGLSPCGSQAEPPVANAVDQPPFEVDLIGVFEAWRKEGALCRDTGGRNPHPPHSLAAYFHGAGWLRRDLQLGLARANPHYRKQQLAFGTITEDGIMGGYPFESHSVLVEAEA